MEHNTVSSVKSLLFQSVQIVKSLVGLGSVFIVHELGQLVACKLFGVTVEAFFLGLGPVFGHLAIGDFMINLCLIPVGGLLVIDSAELALQPAVCQITIFLAGISANLCFALAIYWCRGGSVADVRHAISLFSPLNVYSFMRDLVKQLHYPFDWVCSIVQNLQSSIAHFWDTVALLSVFVALFNLLPFSFCDGGKIIRVLFSSYDGTTAWSDMRITLWTLMVVVGIVFLMNAKKETLFKKG